MPTQEEKITVLEENITILLGIASRQERDIRSIQVGVMSLDRRFDALEGRLYGMDHRLSTLEKRFKSMVKSSIKSCSCSTRLLPNQIRKHNGRKYHYFIRGDTRTRAGYQKNGPTSGNDR